ncbi:GAF domain-containing protein [Chloroflexota bacterium]
MKLQIKVPLLVVVILIFIGIISSGALLHFQRIAAAEQFEHMAMALGGVVQGSLERGMLTGENRPTQEAIIRIGEEEIVNEVVLMTYYGVVTASNEVSHIGKVINGDEIRKTLQSSEVSTWLRQQNGRDELSVIIPVSNKSECYGCHNSETSILGAIQVSVDTTPLNNQIKQQTTFISILGGLTFIIIGGVLAFALKRTVLNPLSRLAASAKRLSQGDYTSRARSDNSDEIGILAQTFNEMAGSVEQHTRELEASHQELARWNIDLEDKIQQRTKELTALNAGITAMSESLDIDRILNDALTKIITVMEIEAGMVHLLDEETDQLIIMAHRGLPPESVRKIGKLKLGEDIALQVFQSGEPIVVNDVMDSPETTAMVGKVEEFQAYISLPVRSKNKMLGSLSLASYLPNRFTVETVRLLSAMGDAMGIAIENAKTVKRLKEANEQFHRLIEQAVTGGFEAKFENRNLVHCWVEKDCDYADCPCYGSENLRCWQVTGTFCGGEMQGHFNQKYNSCTECVVYKKSCQRDELTMIGESFNNMVFLLQFQMQHTERVRGQLLERLISAQEEERRRIARELHDAASQSLAALALNLETISGELPAKYHNTSKRLALLKEEAIETMTSIRELALELRPAILDDLGLARAIRSYAKDYLGKRNIDVQIQVTTNSDTKLPPYSETMLFRIAQEALTNIVKHAEASQVIVELSLNTSSAIMTVKDNGEGFDSKSVLRNSDLQKSLGLYGMSERASLLGGTFRIESEVRKGTFISVEIPLEDVNTSHEQ